MKKIKVRCWEVKNYNLSTKVIDILYITTTGGFGGHEFITCLNCGTVYAVNIIDEQYSKISLEDKLKTIKCINCGINLYSNYSYYPDKYYKDGKIYIFKKPENLPPDDDSIIKEFYSVY